ncbi:uncharacterized protein PHALS_00813 [Plasmopara halstedii]|uniref:Uncharacterized protein n=1 Tax=Plasmopara halstedii TaxID=4781 RepID=A0A0P1ASY6_PLAHL|nr:uncharacterized protein PHALS_00813 [Plasmopara halstedii]CEG44448.1 hypothetical protein PHALS_00813 [Plasmopara halstedii]|eukprot:XP_024580817.1 hypothetical protein PHALS_00813 [Plasmopara halstedii]
MPQRSLPAGATTRRDLRSDLRPMIPLEKEALAAWVRGTLVLEDPPVFIQATHSEAMKASFLQFFEQNLQGRLVATIPPEVFIANHTAETTLLIELRKAFDLGHIKVGELARTSIRMDYNPHSAGHFLPPVETTADAWHGKTIRFKHANLKLIDPDRQAEDDLPTDDTSTEKRKKHALNYQIRVLTHDLTAFKVMQIIGAGTDCGIPRVARQTPG